VQDWYQRLQFDRLIVLSAIATAGVLLTLRATMPLFAVALIVLLSVVTAALGQVVSTRGDDYAWLLTPLLLTLASTLFWRTIPNERAILIGSILFGTLFLVAIVDYHQGRSRRNGWPVSWPNQAVAYIAASMLFATLDAWNPQIAFHAVLVSLIAFAASYSILFREGLPRGHAGLYSIVTAIIAGEVAWALNYWPLPTLQEALMILLHIHIVVGIARANYAKKSGFGMALEYGAVGAITAALVLWTVFGPVV
jgi:hypothetical protein